VAARGARALLGIVVLFLPSISTASAHGACPPVNQQLAQRGDLPKLRPPSGAIPIYTTALGLTQSFKENPAKTQSDAQVLTTNGFQAGSWEYLQGAHHTLKRAGLSYVNVLGSPEGAAAQLSADLEGPRTRLKRQGLRVRRVTVPGIPDSAGYTVQDKRRRFYPGVNLWFLRGNSEYFIGEDGISRHSPRDAQRAAQAIYARVVAAGC
jgi:hypothetical protein